MDWLYSITWWQWLIIFLGFAVLKNGSWIVSRISNSSLPGLSASK